MGVCVTLMVMVTMYKFVSYKGLDCSAFFFWDFFMLSMGCISYLFSTA